MAEMIRAPRLPAWQPTLAAGPEMAGLGEGGAAPPTGGSASLLAPSGPGDNLLGAEWTPTRQGATDPGAPPPPGETVTGPPPRVAIFGSHGTWRVATLGGGGFEVLMLVVASGRWGILYIQIAHGFRRVTPNFI